MRITGGEFRSRTIVAPRGLATRPTSDRVRETIFSMLSSRTQLSGTCVVDLFAGTGSLGLEALSRGAEFATFVESSKHALTALRSNIAQLGVEARSRILSSSVERTTFANPSYDLVFVDPPYALYDDEVARSDLWRVMDQLVASRESTPQENRSPSAWIVLEHSRKQRVASTLTLRANVIDSVVRDAGDTAITLLHVVKHAPPTR